jgi:hypothetical protein
MGVVMMCESYDGAMHPNKEKRDKIWVNIGTEFGGDAVLTMGVGEMSEDGFYDDYVGFDMETHSGIDEMISMLNEAKKLLTSYQKEHWDVLGLPEPKDESEPNE